MRLPGSMTRSAGGQPDATEFQVRDAPARPFCAPPPSALDKLLERIGRGNRGIGLATRPSTGWASWYAIKVLPPSKARDPQILARFQREAQLAQGLQHPNVVRTLEAGEEHGLHYLAMEYLAGQTLQGTLDQRGAPWSG